MRNKLIEFGASGFGALGVIWTIVEIAREGNKWVKVGVIASTVIFAAVAVLSRFKRKGGDFANILEIFNFSPNATSSYSVETVTYPPDKQLKDVADLDKKTYGEDSVDYDGLKSWWNRYRRGVYVLLKNDELEGYKVIGAFGVWPITKTTYEKLARGKLHEHEIKANSICKSPKNIPPYIYWYIGDIILDEEHRYRPEPTLRLLEGAIRLWLESGDLAPEAYLCAIGVRNPGEEVGRGEALLRNQGFKESLPVVSRRDHSRTIPVYVRNATLEQLKEDYRDIRDLLERYEHLERLKADRGPKLLRWFKRRDDITTLRINNS